MINLAQEKIKAIKDFAHQYIYKLLCDQDLPFILSHLDPQLIGIGAAEHNYYNTPEAARDFITSLNGQIPPCRLLNEEWTVIPLAETLYLAQGRHYLTAAEDQQLLVQTHQRATIIIRDLGSDFSYMYVNLSHPYQELQGTENFPFQVGSQTYRYMEAELAKAKEQLQQKQQQMEVVLQSVNGGVKCSNDDATYSYAYISEELPGMFGYSMEEFRQFTDNNATGLVYPPDLPKALADCKECFKDDNPTYSTKYRVPCKDGSLKWIIDSGRKTKTPEGKTIINSIYLDITKDEETRQSELDNERRTRQQYYDLLSSINSNYYFIYLVNLEDGSGIPLRLPETDCSAFAQYRTNGSYDIEPLIRSHFHPDDSTKILEHFSLSGLRRQKQDRHIDFAMECRSSLCSTEYRWTAFNSTLLAQSDGYHQIILTLRDIHEDKLKKLREQQALQEAFNAAQASNMAKNEFLSRMSHDIRTPMNAIIGMTAIAGKNLEDTARLQDCLAKITTASNHLLTLINEVLDMSKIESGKLNLLNEDFSLKEMLEELLDLVNPQLLNKKHTFTMNIAPELCVNVLGDKLRLKQLLLNILANAIKYTPFHGHISLEVRETHVRLRDTIGYEFIITDNGIGMTPEFTAKIFEPFARASDSRTSEIEGTGLGMTIALNIARMMNGTIEVQSVLGEGSAFKAIVYLQPREQEAGRSKALMQTASIDKLQELAFQGKRVLLAEDNELNLEIAVELLKYAGLEITTAKNGLEALDKFKAAPPGTYNLILMDIQMPVMNGLEAAKAIRALPCQDAQTVPIIAMTANAFPEDIAATLQAGMNEHLSKPVNLEQFQAMLQKWCQ
ncbi:PAS domain-containing hybrid sensor histidine kinase/response regulator [uncultured Phascolarctobacterium sp.]|uniref:PAS domain-containing hybrid sensor histidine kinase/response regulator n=1 Tax=uncultured Phascolarctobacterium sp. TaxID=512296 RepID=UPI0025DAA672|nr:PAS domain-containing hybrid sensor histidine kinase/response regulator [uncultured Phascolarctobacterium sp.]